MKDPKAIESAAKAIVNAAKVFAASNPNPTYARETSTISWYLVPEAEETYELAVQEITRIGQGILSEEDTRIGLMWSAEPNGLLELALGAPTLTESETEQRLMSRIAEIIDNGNIFRQVELFVEPIYVDRELPAFYGVELQALSDEERQSMYEDPILRIVVDGRSNRAGVAKVSVRGDATAADLKAISIIEQYLNLLRGCGGDFMFARPVYQFGLVDHADPSLTTAIRSKRQQDLCGQTSMRFLRAFGRTHCASVSSLTSKLSSGHISVLEKATDPANKPTDLLKQIVGSLGLLGEASKDHLQATQMLLLSTALETLLGGESKTLSFKGVTAMLAERTTFLIAAPDMKTRIEQDAKVRRLYSLGSSVRHGGQPSIPEEDVSKFASIVHDAALELLTRAANSWTTVRDLDEWVREQRYQT